MISLSLIGSHIFDINFALTEFAWHNFFLSSYLRVLIVCFAELGPVLSERTELEDGLFHLNCDGNFRQESQRR